MIYFNKRLLDHGRRSLITVVTRDLTESPELSCAVSSFGWGIEESEIRRILLGHTNVMMLTSIPRMVLHLKCLGDRAPTNMYIMCLCLGYTFHL